MVQIGGGGSGASGSGGSGYLAVSGSPFASTGARDTWAAANSGELVADVSVALVTAGDWYLWTGPATTDWIVATPLVQGPQGPAGADGSDGADGATGATGSTGPQGPQGVAGNDGADGRTVLSGSGAPGGGTGNDGDFYIDTVADSIYGPKSGGVWGSATPLVGPAGADGADGADGATGPAGADGADGTSTMIVQDEGSPLSTAANTLNFVGAGVTATGTGSTKTITIPGGGGGSLDNVVDDTTPQLGGALDVNGQKIVSVSNGDIDIEPDGTGNVLLGNFTFDADATVGGAQDNYVLKYDHGTGLIGLEADTGGGDAWGDPLNTNIVPDGDGTRTVGTATFRLANVHTDDIDLNGTSLSGANLADPGVDAALAWDDSAGDVVFFSFGTGLSTSGTTINAEVSLTNTATLTNKTLTAPVINPGVTTDATTARTLALTDASDVVLMSSGSANTVTIPTNASVAFATGTMITIVSTGAGTTTIAGDTGVTLQGNGGSVSAGSCDIQTQYGAAALIKVASDTWVVSGDIDTVA